MKERLTLAEITKKDWVLWHWLEVSAFGDQERVFLRGPGRTPDEAFQAAQEWEVFDAARNEKEIEG